MSVCAIVVSSCRKQAPQPWDAEMSGKPSHRSPLFVLQQAGEQVRLAVAQPQLRRHALCSETTAPDCRRPCAADPARLVQACRVEQDVPFIGDARRRLHVDADRAECVRRQRIDVCAACRQWARTTVARYGSSRTDLQQERAPSAPRSCVLCEQLRVRVRLQELHDRLRHRQIEVGGADALRDRVQIEWLGVGGAGRRRHLFR